MAREVVQLGYPLGYCFNWGTVLQGKKRGGSAPYPLPFHTVHCDKFPIVLFLPSRTITVYEVVYQVYEVLRSPHP